MRVPLYTRQRSPVVGRAVGSGGIRIERVHSRESLEQFARLPYRECMPNARPGGRPTSRTKIDLLAGRTPLSSPLELMPLLARRDGQPVARVSAVVNHRYNQHWNESIGQLIHFEAVAGRG